MRRQHTTPDAYGTDLLERHWRNLTAVAPTGPATAALHTRSAAARTLLAYAAARRSADELVVAAREGRLFPDADAWALGELARVVSLQNLYPSDRADGLALFDSLLRTFGPAGVAPAHQGLHAQIAFAAGDPVRVAKLLADYPAVPAPVREALVVDLATKDEWPGRFAGLLPAPGITLAPSDVTGFDRIRANPATRHGSPHRISTIVTTYRPGPALITTVRSLVAQSWTNHEILVVDDGSGPAYEPMLARAAALDPRVRIIRIPVNGGTYRARNAGLDIAGGDFVTFQDSDDWSHPLRLERQAAPLIEDPGVVATTSAAIRVTEDLVVTRPGYPEFRSYNLSSLMMRREVALDRLGYLDPVRKGADAEYVERARAVFGRAAVRHLGSEPLALIRLTAGSLSGADIGPGWMHPARRAYLLAFQAWHARVAAGTDSAVRSRSPRSRPFAAPRALRGDDDRRRATYDIVLAGDWNAHGDAAWPAAERVRALLTPGRAVAILHLDSLASVAGTPARLDPTLQQMINAGAIDQVVLPDDVHANLVLVHDAEVLGFAPGIPSGIHGSQVVIEADPAWAPAAAHCAAEARRLFGVEPHWAPTDAAARATLAAGQFGARLTAVDVPGTVNPRRWRLHRSGPRADRPVIGRICTGGPAEWQRLRATMTPALDVRVLDRNDPAQAVPHGWLVYRPADLDTRGFLHQLDFYLHLPVDDRLPATCPEVLIAMAAGCIPILPHHHAAAFGTAAVYAAPGEVAALVTRLHRDPAALLAQSERGLAFIEEQHPHARYAEAVEDLLLPPITSSGEVITGEIIAASGQVLTPLPLAGY
ncbi:glycosyltransferase family A protein [Actinoplanes sp. NPDC023801]|uniref:glycosyltransferase family A protein n=1 Tax=Actinoplanes sp. NPDC023801 TaxID=3154595 RepID=UPI0033C5FB17